MAERSANMILLVCIVLIQCCSAFVPVNHRCNTASMLTMSSNEEPTTDKMQATSNIKKVGAALGVLGLVFGKKNLDGPGK